MSSVPAEIAGIGSTEQRLRVSPGFDPRAAAIGPEEYFVLSRIDGTHTLHDVLLGTGLPIQRAIAIITHLRAIGALLLPGESLAPRAPMLPKVPALSPSHGVPLMPPGRPMRRTPSGSRPTVMSMHDLSLPGATPDELAALGEDSELDDYERRRVLAMARLVGAPDPHALLGVPAGADARMLKLAYFQLSKEIHPDRYYGKRLGSFGARMSAVFEATSRAYARLTSSHRGRAHRAQRAHSAAPPDAQPQSPHAYAAELFDRACELEVGGDAPAATTLFAAAVRVDPLPRYLRRAASCALAADQPRSALEYAKKAYALAPHDPSAARLLATAFRAAGQLGDAEEVLLFAMAIKSESDALATELRNDLAEVRRLLAR